MSENVKQQNINNQFPKYDVGEIKRYIKAKYDIKPSVGDFIQQKYDLEERTKRAVKSYQRMGIYDLMMYDQAKIQQKAAPCIDMNQIQARYNTNKGAIYFSKQLAKENLERRLQEKEDEVHSSLQIIGNDKYFIHIEKK